ncbi:transglycosylase family protein [Nosocomiicoccus ampullae]|uniref:Resuscitation-promoting factor core lysozyme-like domain-containing protein n=1 Tax=Nosocomiicoccus ampullae TaxID=489910 RepID=A0A9Q2HFB1_9STAP|nr:transglycosylase family protein [Nosocomiicoccus ampullae]MBB5176064.1 hypothetical protein [Nosocomiicoccus ampullae]QYA46615.1 transglycosylase family protein [Nosocomiicoccus ampullae]
MKKSVMSLGAAGLLLATGSIGMAANAKEGSSTIKEDDALATIGTEYRSSIQEIKKENKLKADRDIKAKELSAKDLKAKKKEDKENTVANASAPVEEVEEVEETKEAVEVFEEDVVEDVETYNEPVEENVIEEYEENTQQESQASAPANDGLNWGGLAACESGGNASAVDPSGTYHGLYQFDAGTWQSVGGSGVASQASAEEQTMRAQMLYEQRGSAPWPVCGANL